MTCQKRGLLPGEVIGALCKCGHVNIAHDEAGCAVCALRALVPAADPKPPTLREQVAELLAYRFDHDGTTIAQDADAVLAVVADWLAAQPLMDKGELYRIAEKRPVTRDDQRAYDVRLLRGGAS